MGVFLCVLPTVPLPVFAPSKRKIAANDAEAKKLAEVSPMRCPPILRTRTLSIPCPRTFCCHDSPVLM